MKQHSHEATNIAHIFFRISKQQEIKKKKTKIFTCSVLISKLKQNNKILMLMYKTK